MKEPVAEFPATQDGGSRHGDAVAPRAGYSVFLPALLIAVAVVASLVFQSIHLATELNRLGGGLAGLEAQRQVAVKLRASLDAVATATAKLASEGNANARVIVAELARRGVTITPQDQSKTK